MRDTVLITSCAAKVPLVRAFREAAAARGMQVLVSDLSPLAPARDQADGSVDLPAWGDPGYGEALCAVCAARRVKLLVPTADGELPVAAALKSTLAAQGVAVLAPPPATVAVCRDKRAFAAFCREQGLPLPRTYAAGEMPAAFPVFVRPGIADDAQPSLRIDSAQRLVAFCEPPEQWLVQEYCTDSEYSVDLLMDLEGSEALQAVVRRRLHVYGGEAQVSRVERVDVLAELAMRLGRSLGLVGHNVVQAFHSTRHGPRLIEVNPRFGGASALAIRAGLDSPARLLDLLRGDQSARRPRAIAFGLTLLRHAADRFEQTDPGA